MKIEVRWDNEAKTIILLTFQPGWAWPDLHRAVEVADQLIVSVPHRVHLIIDIRQAGGLPRDFMTAAGDLFAQGEARPNEGKKIVVGAGRLMRAAYGGFLKVYGSRLNGRAFLFAESLPEARMMVDGSGG
jgi:hypothetical protein